MGMGSISNCSWVGPLGEPLDPPNEGEGGAFSTGNVKSVGAINQKQTPNIVLPKCPLVSLSKCVSLCVCVCK